MRAITAPMVETQPVVTGTLYQITLAEADGESGITRIEIGPYEFPGVPVRYASAGFDNLVVYPQPATPGAALLITYARGPLPLVKPLDVPELPAADHPALWQFAVTRLRLTEGGQELKKAMQYFARFLDTARRRAAQVRARSLNRYDKLPLELERFDLSRVIRLRPDLPPWRKETQWPPASTSKP